MGNCQNFNIQNDPIQDRMKNKQQYALTIKSFTWNRDSHGLFDYESKQISKKVIRAQYAGAVIRHKDDIFLQKDYIPENEDTKNLAQLSISNGEFVLSQSEFIKRRDKRHKKKKGKESDGIGENCIWAIIKSLKPINGQKGYKISQGDYLKFGRVRLRIKDVQDVDTQKVNLDQLPPGQREEIERQKSFKFNEENDVMTVDKIDVGEEEEITCRICLSESEPDNKLIRPCKCDGTMAFIHIKCLQKWLKNKLHPKQTQHSISFVWKTFECELCKKAFPNTIEIDGKKFDTVEIPRPEPPYITMEILSKDKNQTRGIHVITMAQKNLIKLGRGHDADIRIADISVSRCHATLRYDKGSFYLEDNNSKFGTLSLVKDQLEITADTNNTAVQIGRTVLNFNLKKHWKVMSVCFGGPVLETQKVNQQPMQRLHPQELNQQKKSKKEKNKQSSNQPLLIQNQQIQQQQNQSRQNGYDDEEEEQKENYNDEEDDDEEEDEDDDDDGENNILLNYNNAQNQEGIQQNENQNPENQEEQQQDYSQVQEMLDNPDYELEDIEENPVEEEEQQQGPNIGIQVQQQQNQNQQQEQEEDEEGEEEKKIDNEAEEEKSQTNTQLQPGNPYINFQSENLAQPLLLQKNTSAASSKTENSQIKNGISQSNQNIQQNKQQQINGEEVKIQK